MDLFLILYVLGLMVLFFFLGAAIGGVARSFKAYFWGIKDNESFCGVSKSAQDRALAGSSALGGAALGTQADEEAPAVVVRPAMDDVDPVSEWNDISSPETVQLDADVSRDEQTVIDKPWQKNDELHPSETSQDDLMADADVHRDEMAETVVETAQTVVDATPEAEETVVEEPVVEESVSEEPVTEETVEEEPADEQVEETSDEESSEVLVDATSKEEGDAGSVEEKEQAADDGLTAAELAGMAAAAVAVGAALLDDDEEAGEPDEELVAPVETVIEDAEPEVEEVQAEETPKVWDYTVDPDDFSDVVFAVEGADDDLTKIRGIDGNMQDVLNEVGVRRFEQISNFSAREVGFIKSKLGLTREVSEDGWIEQAKILAGGGLTAFVAKSTIDEVVADVSPEVEEVAEATQDAEAEASETAAVEEVQEPEIEAEVEPDVKAEADSEKPEDDKESETEVVAEITDTIEEDVAEEETDLGAIAAAGLTAVAVLSDDQKGDPEILEDQVRSEKQTDTAEEPSDDRSARADREPRVDRDQRLFGREEREQRDSGWRDRYQGERKILPPGERADEEEKADASDGVVGAPPVDSDDLKQIKYISTGLEKKLNLLGVYKLSQIARWSEGDVDNIAEHLELKDRITSEGWIDQASSAMSRASYDDSGQSGGGFFSGLVAKLSELDQITDLSEHEKTMLSKNNVTDLSQIANWSGADVKWARDLLEVSDGERVSGWVEAAKLLISSDPIDAPGGEAVGDEQDLKRIRGIDDDTETKLKEIGVSTYNQIADFQQNDMDRVNEVLGTSGRVERQYWVVQAKVLRDGGDTDFSKLYDGSSES